MQELSKIAMPVVFNEPLSFLQRISEYMEHTHLIHKACSLSDSIDRMQVEINAHLNTPGHLNVTDHVPTSGLLWNFIIYQFIMSQNWEKSFQ